MEPTISPEDIFIRVQETPNPSAVKFVVNWPVKNEGKATFVSAEECRHIPLAESLLNINGVVQVYFFENTITVTHDGSIDFDNLKDCVSAVLKTRLPIHNPNFYMEGETQSSSAWAERKHHENPVLNEIEEILDRTIRPGLQADGGDIEVLELENDELKILYQGACGGCPSSMMGTLEAIQNILRHELGNNNLYVLPV